MSAMARTKAGARLAEMTRPKTELGLTQAGLAKELGVTPQAISGWLRGEGRPSPRHMARLEELAGIPMRDWLEDDASDEPAGAGS